MGVQLWLKGVKHASDVHFNLISVHMLDDGSYDNHFGYGKWKLTKGNLVVARGEKISKLYWTKALVTKDNVSVMDMKASLWHQRLSHINEKWLNCLAKKDVLPGLKNAELEKYSHCMASKQTRVSFKKLPPSRKSELLELVRYDVCRPLKVKSFSGALYFVTFIGDCSRKLWVYTLKTKDQVLENIVDSLMYIAQGIKHEKTLPKTPQLNGLAERMNRTLIEKVRCMLSKAKLPRYFSGETLYIAIHVINLSPIVALNIEVPNKIWFGKDVKYDHLRVFNCKTFVHVPKDERSKLYINTRHCIFIGYGQDKYGYRLYDPVEKKLVKSRNVQFMEDQTIEINKVKKATPKKDNSLSEIDQVWMHVHDLDTTKNNVKNGEQHDYQLGDVFYVPLDNDAEEERRCYKMRIWVMLPNHLLFNSRSLIGRDNHLQDGEEPECYQEVTKSEERQKWLDVMQDELNSLHDFHTYELVKLPKGKKVLENRWIYKVKQESNSASPRKGVDFNEIFSPVVKMSSIRIVLSLTTIFYLEVEQMDVKTTFLHGDLEEEIYMKQPDSFQFSGKEDYVCRVRKSLYGLKASSKIVQAYKKTISNHYVFVRKFFDDDFIILLYVDDMLIVRKNIFRIDRLKKQLSKSFAMKDMRATK
ncbi:hypothetical protein CR513_46544, partial [Mucuna pruriens]